MQAKRRPLLVRDRFRRRLEWFFVRPRREMQLWRRRVGLLLPLLVDRVQYSLAPYPVRGFFMELLHAWHRYGLM